MEVPGRDGGAREDAERDRQAMPGDRDRSSLDRRVDADRDGGECGQRGPLGQLERRSRECVDENVDLGTLAGLVRSRGGASLVTTRQSRRDGEVQVSGRAT